MTWETDAVWFTTKQVADRFGVTQRRVRQLAKDRGVKGRKVGPIWVFTEAEIRQMTPRPPGASGHTRNIICKKLESEVEDIVRQAVSETEPGPQAPEQAIVSITSTPTTTPSPTPTTTPRPSE